MSRCGFGAIDVGPLAQAQFSGELSPSFLPTQYFQPAYMPAGQQSPVGTPYATDSFAAAIASLLGGQVVQAPPPGNLNGTDIPDGDWISVDGEMIWAGNLFPPGIVLSFPDECAAENYLVQSIPGASLSAVCAAGGTGETPTQLAVSHGATIPALPSGQSTIVGYTPPAPIAQTPSQAIGPIGGGVPIVIAAPSLPGPSQVVSSTPGSSVNAPTGAPSTGTPPAASTCFNPLSSFIGSDSCLGPLGIVEWLAVAGLAFWAFSKGGR